MRTLVSISLLLANLAGAQTAWAGTFSEDEIRTLCDGMIERDVITVSANEAMVSYRYNQSSDDLTRAMRATKPTEHRVGGLTSYKTDYALNLSPVFSPAPIEGKYCYRIGVYLDLAKSPIVVSVANDYINQKCAHDVVLEHEMKHVQVYQSFMRYFSKEFKRLFSEELNKVRLTKQTAGVDAEIKRILMPPMREYIEASLRRIQEINDEVDSPEEYERIRNACRR